MVIQPIGSKSTTQTPSTQGRSVIQAIVPTSKPILQRQQPTVTPQPVQQQNNVVSRVQSVVNQAKPVISSIFDEGKKIVSQIPGFVKAAVKHPEATKIGADVNTLAFIGSVGGAIQKGISSITGINVPERWDLTKQSQALKQLEKMGQQVKGEEYVKASETGKFIAQVLPYAVGSEIAGLTIGAKVLMPTAVKFLPQATKFIPLINNAIGFSGIGQLEYNQQEDGSRIDRIKNDLVTLALFEVGGVLASKLSGGTLKLVSKAVEEAKSKLKGGKQVPIEELEQSIKVAREAIAKDTNKTPQEVLVDNMAKASDSEIKTLQADLGTPSKNNVATNLPETGLKVESSLTKAEKPVGVSSTRYSLPSQTKNLDLSVRGNIPTYVNTVQKNSQENMGIFAKDIENATGIKTDVRVKKAESIVGKVERYKLAGKDPLEISDNLAGRVITKQEDVATQIKNIEKNFTVVSTDNFFKTPTVWGYKGVNMKVKLPNGTLAEVQIHTPESLKVAKTIHKTYEKWRNLDMSKLSKEQITAFKKDIADSNKIANAKSSETVSSKVNTEAQTPVGEGVKADSKAYARIKDRFEEEAQLDVSYNKLNLEEDAKKAVDFIAKDPKAATRVSLGLEAPPKGQTERGVTIATADKAYRDGDIGLWNQIEASGSLRQTRRGQEIVVDRGRFNDNSPHRYLAELLDRRLTKLGTSFKSAIQEVQGKVGSAKESAIAKIDAQTAKLKAKLAKDSVKINMAQDLIDSLRC